MQGRSIHRRIWRALSLALALLLAAAPAVYAEQAFIVTTTNRLLGFDTATPGNITTNVAITGLAGTTEQVVAIDCRPANGQIFILTNLPTVASPGRLYTLNTTTGVAAPVGLANVFNLSGTAFGFDFNPTVDRIREVSELDQNQRLNPNDGTLTATDTNLVYAAGDPNATASPNVVGSAYTNNTSSAASTTLFGIDSGLDILVRQGSVDGAPTSPNTGQLFTIGGLGVNTTDNVGFDISQATGTAFAALATGAAAPASNLYTINLTTGAATLVGAIGGLVAGQEFARGLTIACQGPTPTPTTTATPTSTSTPTPTSTPTTTSTPTSTSTPTPTSTATATATPFFPPPPPPPPFFPPPLLLPPPPPPPPLLPAPPVGQPRPMPQPQQPGVPVIPEADSLLLVGGALAAIGAFEVVRRIRRRRD